MGITRAQLVAGEHVLRRTYRSSWMIAGWLKAADLHAKSGGTACMTLGCVDDFVAVRLGFPNILSQPWRITKVIGRASSSFNNYTTATGEAQWTTFTTSNGGKAESEIIQNIDGPTEIEVQGLQRMDQTAGVSWTWTDWKSIRSLPPDPQTGLRVLMLRALIPSHQSVTFANGQLQRFIGDPNINLGFDVFIGGIKFDKDFVTALDVDEPKMPRTWLDNHIVPGTIFPIVQFLTRRAGIAGISTGDSHAQGTSTIEQYRNYGLYATATLRRQNQGMIPFSMVNCAQGGLGSETFFARFATLIDTVRPSYALLPGWTYNDAPNGVNADRYAMELFFQRLIKAVELCYQSGTLPVVLTPFPRDRHAMGPAQLETWRQLRETLLNLNDPYIAVLDATKVLGNVRAGLFDGTYLPPMSDDEMHPNDAGHMAVGNLIVELIQQHL